MLDVKIYDNVRLFLFIMPTLSVFCSFSLIYAFENFNKKCYYQNSVDWSACEDKFKAIEDIHNGEIQLWQYKRTF